MRVYLLNILQANDVGELMNERFSTLIKENNGYVYANDTIGETRYLVQLMFEYEEERERFADDIPQIAFEYEDMDYPEDVFAKIKSGELKCELGDTKPKNHKPTEHELKIDSWLERFELKHQKFYHDSEVDYCIALPNWKMATILLDYRGRYVVGGVRNGTMIACKDRKYICDAVARLLKEFEKELVGQGLVS